MEKQEVNMSRKRQKYLRYLKSERYRTDNLQEAITRLLAAMGGDPQKAKFASLWQSWSDILGEDLASMAFPLGTDKNRLLVGAEDALAMQEIQFQKDEIREKVNNWLGNEYFEDVRISLMFGQKARDGLPDRQLGPETISIPENRPKNVLRGTFLEDMDPNSAVARAYALYVARK